MLHETEMISPSSPLPHFFSDSSHDFVDFLWRTRWQHITQDMCPGTPPTPDSFAFSSRVSFLEPLKCPLSAKCLFAIFAMNTFEEEEEASSTRL